VKTLKCALLPRHHRYHLTTFSDSLEVQQYHSMLPSNAVVTLSLSVLQDWAAQFGRNYRSASLGQDQPRDLSRDAGRSFGTDYLQNWNAFINSNYKPRDD